MLGQVMRKVVRYPTVQNGEWVRPVMKGYRMKCCDCGLVHRIEFRVIRWGRGHKVIFRAFRVRAKHSRVIKGGGK